MSSWFGLTVMLTSAPSLGYESDQLTWRGEWLEDAAPIANAHMDELLAEAVATTNTSTGCAGTDEQLRRALAREIQHTVGQRTLVEARGQLPVMSFGAYAAWLETAPIDRHTFSAREDIYGGVHWRQNLLLATVGPCSTLRLGDVLVGTDKIDHFLVQGFLYFRWSRQGRNTERALRLGTFTERAYWGTATTKTFSYADLAANYDGYRFYAGLLGPGSALQRDEDGCVEQVRPWDWAEWVDWQYDEVLNPPAYRPDILAEVDIWLQDHREELCAAWEGEPWMSAEARLEALLQEQLPYDLKRAPMRMDVFTLDRLCGAEPLVTTLEEGEEEGSGRRNSRRQRSTRERRAP